MAQRLLSARRLCSSAAPRRKRAFRRWALALDASADAFAVEHDAAAASAGLPWRIVAATCVERTPTIMRDAEQWEDAWWNVEDELSAPDPGAPEGFWVKQSEYDFVREVIELQRAAKADGSAEASAAADDAIDSAAEKGGFDLSFLDDQMREAEWEADFVPASRITAADEANDRTSIERKLSKSLYLALPGAGAGAEGSSAAALLPSTAYDSASDGDSLRATAERAVATACGDDVEVFFGSNAPLGHWVRPFAAEEQQASGVYGEKTFLFNARYISGAESLKEGDALWLTREELAEELASAASTTDDFPQFLEHHILGGCVNDIEGVDEPRV